MNRTRDDASTPDADTSLANRRTVEAYETYASTYVTIVSQQPTDICAKALRRLADAVTPAAIVLDIGSGPGWDADYLESLGVRVRRTDVTAAFRAFQAERGKQVEALDLLTDDLGGPHDGVMALYMLQHIGRDATDVVLRKIAGALRQHGMFLVSLREGVGEQREAGSEAGEYLVVLRTRDEFCANLDAAGFDVDTCERHGGKDGDWLMVMARKR